MLRYIVYVACALCLVTGGARASETAATSAVPRLAVLAVDSAEETKTLADLLTVKMTQGEKIEVVERAELERILTEQKLSAAGLAEGKNRVELGRILRADGLVFLKREEARSERQKERFSVRLTETRQGFQVCHFVYPLGDRKLSEIADDISTDVNRSAFKLSLDPAKRLLVSIICIFNATLSPDYFWIEDELPELLGVYFATDSRILMLERRQLDKLLTEAEVTHEPSGEFLAGGVLIDGEVRLKTGETIGGERRPVTFVVRIRNAHLNEIGEVALDGTLDALDELAARTAEAALKKLGAMGSQTGGTAVEEAKVFLELARKRNFLWAAQAAHALDTTNQAAVKAFVSKAALQCMKHDATTPPEEVLRMAQDLARAADLCRDSGSSSIRRILSLHNWHHVTRLLSDPRAMLNEETRGLLRPVRQVIRLQAEADSGSSSATAFLIKNQVPMFFDNPLDCSTYVRALLGRVMDSQEVPRPERMYRAAMIIAHCHQKREFYEELTRRAEREIQFFAFSKLYGLASDQEAKRKYAAQALGVVDSILDSAELWTGLEQADRKELGNELHFRELLLEFMDVCPNEKERIAQKISNRFYSILSRGDLNRFLTLSPQGYLPILPPDDALRIADQAMELRDQDAQVSLDAGYVDLCFSDLKRVRAALIEKYHPEMSGKPETLSRTLLSAESAEWKQLAENMDRHQSEPCSKTWQLTPQRLMLEDSSLWIAFGADPLPSRGGLHAVGLLEMDLRAGKILSLRAGNIGGDKGLPCPRRERSDGQWYCRALSPICRWGDLICVGQNGVGVHLFPARADGGDTSLTGVDLLNKEDGLLNNMAMAVAGVGEDLYIAVNVTETSPPATYSALTKWNRKTRAMILVGNTQSELANSPLAGGGEIAALMGNEAVPCLYVFLTAHGAYYGIWRFLADHDEWKRIAERFGFVREPGPGYRDLLITDGHNLLAAQRALPSDREKGQYLFVSEFDSDTESIVKFGDPQLPAVVFPGDLVPDYDVMSYENGTIAITGYGNRWKIQYFAESSSAPSRTLAWALAEDRSSIKENRKDEAKQGEEIREQRNKLIEAASVGHAQEVEALLAKGEDINVADEKGWTPLIHAVSSNHTDTALLLIREGADIHRRTQAGSVALGFAARHGNISVVSQLLARGVGIDQQSGKVGDTPLMTASYYGQLEMVKFLLEHGAGINARNVEGESALAMAAQHPNSEVVKYLLQKGAEADACGHKGITPLIWATSRGQVENMRILLKAGADINRKEFGGGQWTALFEAAYAGRLDAVKFLIENGLDVESRDARERTVLMVVAERPYPEVLKYLIEQGADINARGPEERTILYYAVVRNQTENVRILLEAGADLMARFRLMPNTESTFNVMEIGGNDEVRAILQEALGRLLRKSRNE